MRKCPKSPAALKTVGVIFFGRVLACALHEWFSCAPARPARWGEGWRLGLTRSDMVRLSHTRSDDLFGCLSKSEDASERVRVASE